MSNTDQMQWEHVVRYDDADNRVATTRGILSYEQWLLAAAGLASSEPSDFVFSEEAGDEPGVDGGRIDYHRVLVREVPQTGQTKHPLQRISEELLAALATMPGTASVQVEVQPLEFQQRSVLVPPQTIFDEQTIASARQLRAELDSERAAYHQGFVARVEQWAAPRSATINEVMPTGDLVLTASVADVRDLITMVGVGDVSLVHSTQQACNPSCSMVNPNAWKTGEGRSSQRLDTQRFIDAGFSGERPNPNRHSFTDITIAIVENGPLTGPWAGTTAQLEDESCFLGDVANDCSSTTHRNKGMWECNPTCVAVSNFADGDNDRAYHSSVVIHAAVGDLENHQAQAYAYGDACWSGAGHCADWERASSGMAPEAGFLYYGTPTSGTSKVSAFSSLRANNADIMNASWGSTGGLCDIASSTSTEDELENAFDNGVLNVVATGNNGTSSCTVWAPADTPKALAIGSFNVANTSCVGDYTTCPYDALNSRRGGGTAVINGVTVSNAMSMVDLLGPSRYVYRGSAQTAVGMILDSTQVGGSSVAAPHVAGAAALLKDFHIANGDIWVNNPGRLHTLMLSMGDRWGSSGQRAHGNSADRQQWGFGRLKMRLLTNGQGMGPWAWSMYSTTITPSTNGIVRVPFANPMGANASLLKCVLYEAEDMSAKSDVNDAWLSLQVREPVGGVCTATGSLVATVNDGSYDHKHFAAVESGALGGRCAVATIQTPHVGTNTNVHLFCYYAGISDDQPN